MVNVRFADKAMPQIRDTPHYIIDNSAGYDGQFYAQVAMDPLLRDQNLPHAVDNFSYRTRRILMPAVAHVAGLGRPIWILQAFSLINVVAWLGLALVVFRWFRPGDPDGWIRWFGVLFGAGLLYSIRNALPDGPALLLIAVGLILAERNRMAGGAVALALATLTRETSVLAAAILPPDADWRGWRWSRLVFSGLIIVLPIGLWLLYVYTRGMILDTDRGLGARNFTWPFFGWFGAWRDTFLWDDWTSRVWFNRVVMMVSVTVQMAFFLFRWRIGERAWRLGLATSLLGMVLGPAVWAGYPMATIRVLLPLSLAFNLAVPRGRRWLPLLLIGNISVVAASSPLTAPDLSRMAVVTGVEADAMSDGRAVWSLDFGPEWFPLESKGRKQWRWAPGEATVTVENGLDRTEKGVVSLGLRARESCELTVAVRGEALWSGHLARETQVVDLPVELPPGRTVITFVSPDPPVAASWQDERMILFRIERFELNLLGTAPATRE